MADTPIDALIIDIEAKASNADKAIDKFANAIGNLANSLARVDTGKLNSVGNGIQRLSSSLQTMKSIDTRSINSVVNKINSLSAIDTSQFATVSANLHQMANGIQSLGTVSANVASVGELAKNISKLGNKSVQTAITNIPQLATSLKGLISELSHAPRVSQNVIQMTNALANLTAQGSKVGSASSSIVKGLNRASSSATRANKSFKGLASTFGRFYANCFLVIRGVKSLWSSIEGTADYLEAFNYFEVALNKVGGDWASDYEKYGYENAESYANSFKTRLNESLKGLSGVQISIDANGETGLLTDTGLKNLGLNIQEVTQYASQLASVTNSVGQTGEVTLATASAFTKLGADMSSLFNVDYSSVMNNLQSGLIGQSRALYKYGIDITNATLQTYAYELGVEKAVSEMTQAEKMQLRMIAILDQSRVSWGDQANTINSLSNSIRQFKNNISEAGQILGQLFVPIMSKLMPVINGVTIAIKRLMVSIAGLLGIELDLSEFGQGTSGVEEDIDGITDAYDDATAAAKKFSTTTLGIDELNINAPQTDTSGETSGGVSGGLDLTDEILKATGEYEKAWQEAYDRMQNKAEEFADKITKAFEPIKKIFEDIAVGDWFAVGKDTSNLVTSIFDFFSDAIDSVDWYGIGRKIGNFFAGINWKKTLRSVGRLIWKAINASIELWKGSFDAAPIETSIITAIAALSFTGLGSVLYSSIKNSITTTILDLAAFLSSAEGWIYMFSIASPGMIGELGLTIERFLQGTIFDTNTWTGIPKKIDDTVNNFIYNVFKPAINDLFIALGQIILDTFNWSDTIMIWNEARANFEKGGLYIILGILEGILSGITFILEPIKDFCVSVFETFCEVLGIHSPAEEMKPIGKNIVLGIAEGFSDNVKEFLKTVQNWWENDLKPWFTKEKWLELIEKIPEAFETTFKNAANGVIEIFNKLIGWINEKMQFSWDAINIAGKEIVPAGSVQLFTIPEIPKFKEGGFVEPNLPRRYSVLMAGEDGIPEIAGTVGGKPAVASGAEITGIKDAVLQSSDEETRLLREQNELLRMILQKDMSVNISDREIYKAGIRGSKSYGRLLVT